MFARLETVRKSQPNKHGILALALVRIGSLKASFFLG